MRSAPHYSLSIFTTPWKGAGAVSSFVVLVHNKISGCPLVLRFFILIWIEVEPSLHMNNI